MSLLQRLLSGSGKDRDTVDTETALTCDCCGCDVEADEMEEGQCAECYNSEYSGPRYCCGAIYEHGEDTCASCGEAL